MSIIPGLREFLLGDSAISAVIGARVYPVDLPQNATFPAVRVSHVSDSRVVSSRRDLGLASPRIQIDAFGASYKAAADLAQLILRRLSGYRGRMGSREVQGVFPDTVRDGFEAEAKLYFVGRDYFIHFTDDLTA